MNSESYSEMLRQLSKEYYQSHIGFAEYREQRKVILDAIDTEYNGVSGEPSVNDSDDASLLSKALGFFKKDSASE
jgi:hypothetical protein